MWIGSPVPEGIAVLNKVYYTFRVRNGSIHFSSLVYHLKWQMPAMHPPIADLLRNEHSLSIFVLLFFLPPILNLTATLAAYPCLIKAKTAGAHCLMSVTLKWMICDLQLLKYTIMLLPWFGLHRSWKIESTFISLGNVYPCSNTWMSESFEQLGVPIFWALW